MDSGRIKSILEAEIQNAIGWLQSETTVERTRALNYYLRAPYGNEVDGRSKVVTGEVAEAIDGALPQLMRVFTTSEDIVSFEPASEEDIEAAQQATDYCNLVFTKDNPGFLILYSWFKDALMLKNCAVMWRWKEQEIAQTERVQNISDMQLALKFVF